MVESGGPGGVLALHLGEGGVGWCYGSSDLGLWRLPKSQDHGLLAAALVDQVADFCRLMSPKLIVLSGPPDEVEAGATSDVAIAVLHIGLLACVRLFAYRKKIRIEVPNIHDVRQAKLGRQSFSRGALRDAVLSFAARRGLDALELDAGHALVLWSYQFEKAAR